MEPKALQSALATAGYDPGPIDGDIGPKTTAALARAAGAGRLMVVTAPAVSVAQPSPEPPWLPLARARIGEVEIAGPRNNPVIVGWWSTIHSGWFKDDETPWCAAFVGAMLEQAGIRSSRSAAARSYEAWGQKLGVPALGCIVVFKRDGGGHVGFVVGKDKAGNLMVLGGNQGDAVSIKPFSRARVTAFRWPSGAALPAAALPLVAGKAQLSTNEV